MNGPLNRATRLVSWFVRPFAGQEPSFYRAVTACLLAAGLFWQMNALNKTYTTRLNYPLAWHYDSARYLPLRPLRTVAFSSRDADYSLPWALKNYIRAYPTPCVLATSKYLTV